MTEPSPKTCAVCGRRIEWRKKWERSWDDVKYCSDKCRKQKLRPIDTELEHAILHLLNQRANGATICPSEAAKAIAAVHHYEPEQWRDLMEPTRQAARRLVANDRVVITQKGRVVDPSTAKGPIRIRLT